jgi:hypothetical protein
MARLTLFAAATGSQVDREAGILRGVSVITAGVEAKGHGIWIDQTSLEMVKAAAETYVDGLQVKSDHGSGFGEIEGVLRNFQIDGNQLRADFYLIKSGEEYERIMEMAEMMPSSFGLSIEFSGISEEIDEYRYARPLEIYAVALVDQPAANPTGLFQAMTEEIKPEEVPAVTPAEEVKVEEVTTSVSPLVETIPAPEVPAEEVEQVESEAVTEDESLVSKEVFEVKGPEGTQNLPESVKEDAPAPVAELPKDDSEKVIKSKLSAVVESFELQKGEIISLRADLETAHRNLHNLRSEVEKRDLRIADLEETKRIALQAVGLLPSDVELEVSPEAAPFNPAEAYFAAIEAGDKKLSAELFKAHKSAIFAARRK